MTVTCSLLPDTHVLFREYVESAIYGPLSIQGPCVFKIQSQSQLKFQIPDSLESRSTQGKDQRRVKSPTLQGKEGKSPTQGKDQHRVKTPHDSLIPTALSTPSLSLLTFSLTSPFSLLTLLKKFSSCLKLIK